MLRIKSTIYLTGQAISNDRNSKIQTMSRPGRFWSLNIGICDFRHKTPIQSHIALTPAMRDRLGLEDQLFNVKINLIHYVPIEYSPNKIFSLPLPGHVVKYGKAFVDFRCGYRKGWTKTNAVFTAP